uniref:RH18724p n=1 Tax=Drosophila melanogaster TaxID=7227 RepID=Q6NN59_DROME
MRYKIQYLSNLYYPMHFLKLILGIQKILVYFLACNSKVFNDFLPVQLQLLPSPSVSSPLSPFGLCSALSSAVFGFQFATPSPSPTPSVTPLSPTPFPPVPLYP